MRHDLVLKTLRDRSRPLFWWSLGLVGITAMQIAVYPSVRKSAAGMSQFLEQYPEALKALFRLEDYTSGSGYLSAEMFSVMVPLVFIAVGAAAGAAATAGEEERGTLDLLMSLPTSRVSVVVSKSVAMVVTLTFLGVLLFGAILVGGAAVDLHVSAGNLAETTFACALLGLLFGAVALALGAVSGRRAVALGMAIGLGLAAFLVYGLAPLADWLKPWEKTSPFYWVLGNNPLKSGVDWSYLGLMAAVTVALLVLAGWAFRRRDIRV